MAARRKRTPFSSLSKTGRVIVILLDRRAGHETNLRGSVEIRAYEQRLLSALRATDEAARSRGDIGLGELTEPTRYRLFTDDTFNNDTEVAVASALGLEVASLRQLRDGRDLLREMLGEEDFAWFQASARGELERMATARGMNVADAEAKRKQVERRALMEFKRWVAFLSAPLPWLWQRRMAAMAAAATAAVFVVAKIQGPVPPPEKGWGWWLRFFEPMDLPESPSTEAFQLLKDSTADPMRSWALPLLAVFLGVVLVPLMARRKLRSYPALRLAHRVTLVATVVFTLALTFTYRSYFLRIGLLSGDLKAYSEALDSGAFHFVMTLLGGLASMGWALICGLLALVVGTLSGGWSRSLDDPLGDEERHEPRDAWSGFNFLLAWLAVATAGLFLIGPEHLPGGIEAFSELSFCVSGGVGMGLSRWHHQRAGLEDVRLYPWALSALGGFLAAGATLLLHRALGHLPAIAASVGGEGMLSAACGAALGSLVGSTPLIAAAPRRRSMSD